MDKNQSMLVTFTHFIRLLISNNNISLGCPKYESKQHSLVRQKFYKKGERDILIYCN